MNRRSHHPAGAMTGPRLPAGALVLVLVVSIIIAAILLSLIFLTTSRRLLVQRDTIREAVRRNLFSGLAYAQAQSRMTYFQPRQWDLFGQGTDSVRVERKPWGMFDVAVVTASRGRWRDTCVAMLGSRFALINQAALYLADEHVPLSVNADAQVRGRAYLPGGQSARPASLPLLGTTRNGPAVTGALQTSAAALPYGGDTALIRLRHYTALQLAAWLPAGSRTQQALQSQRVSFAGAATVLYQGKALELKNLSLSGQIVVVSARRLVVDASAQLDNVLLLAPVVVLKAGFHGRVQIFARDTVEVQQGCELLYPSAVCAYSPTQAALVSLGTSSRISGTVIAAGGAGGPTPLVHMEPGVTVQGQVLSTGVLENCGNVQGTVMCRRLLYRTASTLYDNYLVNAVLDQPGLAAAFLTTPLLNPGAPTGIVAWLP